MVGMASQSELLASGGSVPDLHRLVLASGDDSRPIGTDRHAVDGSGMALEGCLRFHGGSVPDIRRRIETAGDDTLAIGADSGRVNEIVVPAKGLLVGE
jgi:hypothetical protein